MNGTHGHNRPYQGATRIAIQTDTTTETRCQFLHVLGQDDMYDLLGEDVYDFVVQKLKENLSAPITLTALKGWN